MSRLCLRWVAVAVLCLASVPTMAAEWTVPVAGNSYRGGASPEGRGAGRGGTFTLSQPEDICSIFFHVDRAATVDLGLIARVQEGKSTVVARVNDAELETPVEGAEFTTLALGKVEVPAAGYVRVDLQGKERSSRTFAEIRDLVVSSDVDGLVVTFVKTNEGNMFYWGRRGPSVHLTYETPRDSKIQYGYSEITVPKGEDTMGSYYMANGFGEGYFGIQVNGPSERRVLFSVWSPFQTDNPRDIPEDQRIVCLGSGPEVRVGEFGNEGSGGQSFLVYPWQAGLTYCFLTEVKPDGPSHTVYTSWFCEKSKQDWRMIASFRRPQTTTHLRRFHSFLENFNPSYGHITRTGQHGNVWVRDVEGEWHECTRARFSVDATGGGRHRLDFKGGSEGDHFFLQNCGFFSETGKPGDVFARQPSADGPPKIDFDALPRP